MTFEHAVPNFLCKVQWVHDCVQSHGHSLFFLWAAWPMCLASLRITWAHEIVFKGVKWCCSGREEPLRENAPRLLPTAGQIRVHSVALSSAPSRHTPCASGADNEYPSENTYVSPSCPLLKLPYILYSQDYDGIFLFKFIFSLISFLLLYFHQGAKPILLT